MNQVFGLQCVCVRGKKGYVNIDKNSEEEKQKTYLHFVYNIEQHGDNSLFYKDKLSSLSLQLTSHTQRLLMAFYLFICIKQQTKANAKIYVCFFFVRFTLYDDYH